MKITPGKINSFMFFKLPLAWIGGVRVKEITDTSCIVKIKHRWMNQNPFKSMFLGGARNGSRNVNWSFSNPKDSRIW